MEARTFYVIRHKRFGTLLPARVCATKWAFVVDGLEPRLFRTARAANNCATCWAQGEWRQEVRTESEGWEYPSYEYLAEPAPTRVEGRNREDLEVLEVTLTLP